MNRLLQAARPVVLACGAFLAGTTPSAADLPSPFISGAVELWSGADAAERAWSAYSGINWSPAGSLAHDGLRIRLSGGYGEYRYAAGPATAARSIYGTATFADLLVGYQMGLGDLTLKAYLGATFDAHLLDPLDSANPVSGRATGAKAALEAWYNITDATWLQLDLARSTAHDGYGSRLRLGYRVTRELSFGVEAGAFGNESSDSGRGGAFIRYEWLGGEVSVSGGLAGDIGGPIEMPRKSYGTLGYLARF